MPAYYNEIDPYAARWLRNLIAAGHIAPGDVDERSIVDVKPDDLIGYDQCHFFAGIGGWSLAARLAGWPDDRPLWTGSCPCQPFSAAGKRKGEADDRHLWPVLAALVRERRPAVVAGEQVASKDGLRWLDGVCADLEAADYSVWAADFCAASVGAPHIRQRLWWLADAQSARRSVRHSDDERATDGKINTPSHHCEADGVDGWLADSIGQRGCGGAAWSENAGDARQPSKAGGVADYASKRLEEQIVQRGHRIDELQEGLLSDSWSVPSARQPNPIKDEVYWGGPDRILCRDRKWRPVEAGTFPLAHGIPNRVGRLRAYGNAIVPQVAAQILRAYLD